MSFCDGSSENKSTVFKVLNINWAFVMMVFPSKVKNKNGGCHMDNMWLVFFWSGPIGIGIFLALLGTFIWLLAKANEISKRAKKE
jgi:hypothetical protein